MVFTLGAVTWMNLGAFGRIGVTAARDPTTTFWVIALSLGAATHGAVGLRAVGGSARLPTWLWKGCTLAYLAAMFTLAYLLSSI